LENYETIKTSKSICGGGALAHIGYGQYIGDRIQEMTNIVEMTGESRREKWEEEKTR
jgi:hypothetical protein